MGKGGWGCGYDSNGRKITAVEEFEMGPIRKMFVFGIVPWRMVTLLLLIVANTIQVHFFANVHGQSQRAIGPNPARLFFAPSAFDNSGDDADFPAPRVVALTRGQLDGLLRGSLERYFNLTRTATQPTRVAHRSGNDVCPGSSIQPVSDEAKAIARVASASSTSIDAEEVDPSVGVVKWELKDTSDYFPLNKIVPGEGHGDKALMKAFQRLRSLEYQLPLETLAPRSHSTWSVGGCLRWKVILHTRRVAGGGWAEIVTSVFPNGYCDPPPKNTRVRILSLITLLLAGLFEATTIYDTIRAARLILSFRSRRRRESRHSRVAAMEGVGDGAVGKEGMTSGEIWAEMSFWQRLQLFRPWVFVATLGNFFTILYCLVVVVSGVATPTATSQFLLGCAAPLLWLSSLQFAEFDVRTNTILLTLQGSIRRIASLFVGIFPIFMGFVVLGMTMFGSYVPRYSGMLNTIVTLFAFINGDAVRETMTRTVSPAGPGRELWVTTIGEAYGYTSIALFTFVSMNVIIAFAEEAFFATRPKGGVDVNTRGGRPLPVMLRALLDNITKESIARANVERMEEEQDVALQRESHWCAWCRRKPTPDVTSPHIVAVAMTQEEQEAWASERGG